VITAIYYASYTQNASNENLNGKHQKELKRVLIAIILIFSLENPLITIFKIDLNSPYYEESFEHLSLKLRKRLLQYQVI
jgi:hypothetical protein